VPNSYDYTLSLTWTGNRGTGTSGVRDFDRSIIVEAENQPRLQVTADAPFHGIDGQWNPEQLLLASLSSCHMLSFFYVALQRGIVVVSYTDSPSAALQVTSTGAGAIQRATLRPVVSVGDATTIEDALQAHNAASQLCFINNSVNFVTTIEPTVVAAPASA
jgi:organic hydroperoxide reductase OsmC/OhrA